VSPILTRPVREQLEHDRIIRQLPPRYKRKHEVVINPGTEQNQSVKVGELAVFPDALLLGSGGRRLEGTVEVETGESVNQLEALAEWAQFTKLRVPFHLYVPPQSIDTARRLCEDHHIPVAELWTYHLTLDQVRFTLVHRDAALAKVVSRPTVAAASKPKAAKAPARKPAKAKAKPKAVARRKTAPKAPAKAQPRRGRSAKPAKAAAKKPSKKPAKRRR
jgi:hypothetical protein